MDRRITKTKEAIQNAFFQLIEENQTTKITITKIAKTANIDRKTFYTHYNSPTDIIVEFCEQKTKEFFAHLEKENFFDQPLNSQNVFSAIYELLETRFIFVSKFCQSFRLRFILGKIQRNLCPKRHRSLCQKIRYLSFIPRYLCQLCLFRRNFCLSPLPAKRQPLQLGRSQSNSK